MYCSSCAYRYRILDCWTFLRRFRARGNLDSPPYDHNSTRFPDIPSAEERSPPHHRPSNIDEGRFPIRSTDRSLRERNSQQYPQRERPYPRSNTHHRWGMRAGQSLAAQLADAEVDSRWCPFPESTCLTLDGSRSPDRSSDPTHTFYIPRCTASNPGLRCSGRLARWCPRQRTHRPLEWRPRARWSALRQPVQCQRNGTGSTPKHR